MKTKMRGKLTKKCEKESKYAIESENERWKENWKWKMQGKVGKCRNGEGHKGWAVHDIIGKGRRKREKLEGKAGLRVM